MNLGVLLSPGDSLTNQQRTGQFDRLLNYYLKPYAESFDRVFVFSYGDKAFRRHLPAGVTLVTKPWPKLISKQVDIFRVFQAVGGLPAVLSGKPFVVTYGYDYPRFALIEGRRFAVVAMKIILPLVLKKAKKIIITTKDSLSLIKSWQTKAVLIPNGVDPEIFKPGGTRDPWMVLSVGRLVKQKNYPLLLSIVSNSRFKSKIKLVIIGQGPLRQELLSLAQNLKVNLKIVDNLPHQKLVGWYQKATIFALTSTTEGQSKALLEALSCGLPCLTTQFSGNPLGGYLAYELPKKLDKMLGDGKLRKQLGTEGRTLIKKEFDLTKLVNKEIKLLKSCV
jgi:glycosyltransferase involved in cell wall biosynthesis